MHGSAPKYAGKDVINPTALILSAVLMLRYLELFEQADAIEHAVLVTLEDGTLTGDVVGYGNGGVDDRLHRRDHRQPRAALRAVGGPRAPAAAPAQAPGRHRLREADVPLRRGDGRLHRVPAGSQRAGRVADGAHPRHAAVAEAGLSRGTKVFPPTGAITDTVDHYRCRFIIKESPGDLSDDDVHRLLVAISRRHRWMHIEKLQEFDGELGFTRDQGELRGRAA